MLDPGVSNAIADVFGVVLSGLTHESNRETISDCDSARHFRVSPHLEEVRGTRFPAKEIGNLTTAERIQEALPLLKVLP